MRIIWPILLSIGKIHRTTNKGNTEIKRKLINLTVKEYCRVIADENHNGDGGRY